MVVHFDANYIDLRYGASNSLSSSDVALKGFPGGSDDNESTCSVGDLGLIPGLGRSPGGEHGNPLQYSCLENPYGQRSLVSYSPWDCKESDMTERSSTHIRKMRREFFF